MAMSKTLFSSTLISLLILHLVHSDSMVITMDENPNPNPSLSPSPSPSPSLSPDPLRPKIDCEGACNGRCKLSSRQKICKRACETCCDRCNCVPSGTYDQYEECPCYANMTTHGANHKCP